MGKRIFEELSRWLSCATGKENASWSSWRHSLSVFTHQGSRTICWDPGGCRNHPLCKSPAPNAPSPFLPPHQPFSNLSVDQKNQEGMFKQTTGPRSEFLVSNIWNGAQDSAFLSSCLGLLGCWAQGPTLGTAVPARQEHKKTVPLFPSAPPL